LLTVTITYILSQTLLRQLLY